MKAVKGIATFGLFGVFCAGSAFAQTTIFHDPFLNWDFRNFTGGAVDDFEIVVEGDDFVPNGVYTGPLGFPNFQRQVGDFDPDPGPETRLRWSGRSFPADAIAHVGLGMLGSGRILDAYWTLGGQKVGPSIGITYERTRVRRPVTGGPAEISMVLNTSPAFARDNPNTRLFMQNIRTFMDIPADLLGLDDITSELNLTSLAPFETVPDPVQGELFADSFFDVWVGLSVNSNPNFESLLVADLFTQAGTQPPQIIGRFWNINPQCPEPGTAMLMLAAMPLLARRRRAVS